MSHEQTISYFDLKGSQRTTQHLQSVRSTDVVIGLLLARTPLPRIEHAVARLRLQGEW